MSELLEEQRGQTGMESDYELNLAVTRFKTSWRKQFFVQWLIKTLPEDPEGARN